MITSITYYIWIILNMNIIQFHWYYNFEGKYFFSFLKRNSLYWIQIGFSRVLVNNDISLWMYHRTFSALYYDFVHSIMCREIFHVKNCTLHRYKLRHVQKYLVHGITCSKYCLKMGSACTKFENNFRWSRKTFEIISKYRAIIKNTESLFFRAQW